ncbi:nicotinate-nucleotide pyrophosphorylase [Chlorobium limicola DSM 245]|uniref:Probable nicotinate-nucleotide pyrophosphorylase [carboxylating] n=1 Tax=Chlorobium limicola (strain DSM 245 / NBRC 103803 / 6330) TaxID=290315 RepID=B3EGQ0_CHLL2|nr:carboxylating nicotinate-nucleotide diphosphorylase [Chlorobium limicola]ACD91163.1 nicotinate-nucleotide pyrophosphorylase [Chlorobium limicola DSM 245]
MPHTLSDFYAGCRSRAVILALEEDRYTGDITTLATIRQGQQGCAVIKAKAEGVLAGASVAEEVFKACDPGLTIVFLRNDGDHIRMGDTVLEVSGGIASLLMAERTVLNFMQRMSGIATRTNTYVNKISHTGTAILDTRKTVPGLRYFDKEAVRIGGGKNHRFGLFDMILIKDNHIDACGGVGNAVREAVAYRKNNGLDVQIETEVRSLEELAEALPCGPDIVLLDNLSVDMLQQAVAFARAEAPSVKLEASGNVGLHNVAAIAETGVDYISIGELTHSVTALDLSMTIALV